MNEETVGKYITEFAEILNLPRPTVRVRITKGGGYWKVPEVRALQDYYKDLDIIQKVSYAWKSNIETRAREQLMIKKISEAIYLCEKTTEFKVRHRTVAGVVRKFSYDDLKLMQENLLPDEYQEAMELIKKYETSISNSL